MMKLLLKQIKTRNFVGSIGIVFLLSQLSCRTSDTENNLTSGGIATVKINLTGTEFSDSPAIKPTASIGKKSEGNENNEIQTKSTMVNPSTILVAQLESNNHSVNPQASAGKNLSAAVAGDPLGSGIKFRVIAYEQGSGSYKSHQDYTIGQPATPLIIDAGITYNMVIYSYGTNSLPSISSGETTSLNSAVVNYDDNNRDFMYQNISYTPSFGGNTLDITLKHRVARITTIVNSTVTGSNISTINNAMITPHYTNGSIPLTSGNVTGRTDMGSAALTFPISLPASSQTALPVFVNTDTRGASTASFSADVIAGGTTYAMNLANSFSITPGTTSTLTIKLTNCGAYIAPGVWKNFMCHNLGADYTAYPGTPSAAIHGAKYQWGAQTGETGRYYSQSDDQTNAGQITGWSTAIKPVTTWSDAVKTANDPCPSGYRVPTRAQLQGVIDNNTMTQIGTWISTVGNYTSGAKYGDLLFLPTAGNRDYQTGRLGPRGNSGYYWTCTAGVNITAYMLNFTNTINQVAPFVNRNGGFSIRCIAE
ncbi:TPA: hypothetical protein ACGZ99_003591 [Elizabethkingia anophelis]